MRFTYFAAVLNQVQLERIEDANLILGHHGRSEEEYAKAREVLDRVQKTTGLFRIVDYKLAGDPERPGMLHVDYLKFSFDPGIK